MANNIPGLDRRYSTVRSGFRAYHGLIEFINCAQTSKCKVDEYKIVNVVTGSSTELQRPGHKFFWELVNVLPSAAGPLIRKVEYTDYRNSSGTRLNILTGALLGI